MRTKTKTTQKYIKSIENNIIKIGYCDIQSLLSGIDPNYYTCGVYGWNADIYIFNDCTIVTGYRPFGNISPSYEMCRDYDNMAREIRKDWNITREAQDEKIYKLLNEFINIVLERSK